MDIPPQYIFITICLLVPAQYMLSPSRTAHLKYYLNNVIDTFRPYLSEVKEVDVGIDELDEVDESVLDSDDIDKQRINNAYGLGEYRRSRSPNIAFRVGDVIYHKKQGYKGVVIGWDPTAIAPQDFIDSVHKGNKEWTNNPNYAVLIDTRDRLTPQIGYVIQKNLELAKGRVIHPYLDRFFDYYDETNTRYTMRPFLRKIYPDD